jgi:hypothetical protein
MLRARRPTKSVPSNSSKIRWFWNTSDESIRRRKQSIVSHKINHTRVKADIRRQRV